MQPTFIFGPQFNDIVLPLIQDTDLEIRLVIFDWRFETLQTKSAISKFNQAIISAVMRGVNVRAIVNSRMIAERLNNLGIKAKFLESKRLLHTKLLILDNRRVVVGSHNYTESALTSNHEVSVFFELIEDTNELVKYFDTLWSY